MALQQHTLMDKAMMVVLGFLLVGIPIAFVQPDTGELRDPPLYLLFCDVTSMYFFFFSLDNFYTL